MSYFYVKDNEPFFPEAINPDLEKIAKAIVKTCRFSFKLQMKTTALSNSLKNGDKNQMRDTMLKCIEKNRSIYNQDISLTGVKIEDTDVSFLDDKDEEFFKNQLKVLIDFAAINCVVEGRMMPLMSDACEKKLGTPIDKIKFFTNQTEILESPDEEEEGTEE